MAGRQEQPAYRNGRRAAKAEQRSARLAAELEEEKVKTERLRGELDDRTAEARSYRFCAQGAVNGKMRLMASVEKVVDECVLPGIVGRGHAAAREHVLELRRKVNRGAEIVAEQFRRARDPALMGKWPLPFDPESYDAYRLYRDAKALMWTGGRAGRLSEDDLVREFPAQRARDLRAALNQVALWSETSRTWALTPAEAPVERPWY